MRRFGTISDSPTRSTSSQRFFEINLGFGENIFYNDPSKPFLMIIVGFVIRKNMSTSEPFAQDLVPTLESSKSLADYIRQVALEDLNSLVYSKNDIKSAQNGGGFSVLQLLSLPIVYTTNYLAGDNRRDIDETIGDTAVVKAPSLNALYILVYNSKAKEEMFRSNFLLADVQDFLSGYENVMNKDDYLKKNATEERKKPSSIDHIEASVGSVLNEDGL